MGTRNRWLGVVISAIMVGVWVCSVSAALFEQDFSSSTNVADYIDDTAPTANQFTLINGATASVEDGRLKLIKDAGVGGNIRRWIDMEGSPVTAMSFAFDMELSFSEVADTRLFTGTIGEEGSGNHWMAWGVEATGTDNEWKVTGTTDAFTGVQTVTIFLNDSSESPISYTDPEGGTQLLAANSYDVWVGATQVADGKTDAFVHPEKDLKVFDLGLVEAPSVAYYFDSFDVQKIPESSMVTIYQDDFSGAATNSAKVSVPEISLPGFYPASALTGLDGNGRLEAAGAGANANYRFRIDTQPLTDDSQIQDIKYKVVMRTPTNDWIMIGFQQYNANGLLTTEADVGPVVQFNPNGTVILRGGSYPAGNNSAGLPAYYTGSDIIIAEMTYHVGDQTMDLVINDKIIAMAFDLGHEFPAGISSDPVVYWLQAQLRNQQTAANGGAYLDSLQIDVAYTKTIPLGAPVIVYQDDFSGPATTAASVSVPEVYSSGFSPISFNTGLDGNGLLESVGLNPNTDFRFQIATDPLTDDVAVEDIKYTAEIRVPANDWVMIGFQGADSVGMLSEDANVGPMVLFAPAYTKIFGGTWGGGNQTPNFQGYGSEVITAEMTYHVTAQTVDLAINGTTLTNGFAIGHEFPLGTNSDPVVNILQVVLRNQTNAASGGAYIDSLKVEKTFTTVGYVGWALSWSVDIGASTNDYDGDGLSNLYEYGLGGDPTDALDQGTSPTVAIENVGGTNWLNYVCPQRSDAGGELTYSVELTTNLVSGTWVNAGYSVLGTNVTGDSLDFVTNTVDMMEDQKFIRLIIE
ncbi:hypothetical protein [Tichowtungia aerotolerans]|uniref:Uncharacterized protein n=1 Tax=Tichowtungia aerotolerans TaxID=2697043 RepID=A0A6P1M4W1_9BACT|nr:hypothetical protein [Tichowtungia aerotolerans]QHI69829.1 hypothetical protein GT409_10330 [Tichowtungia aerotolerans]